jgi:hypothetical protein
VIHLFAAVLIAVGASAVIAPSAAAEVCKT